MTDNDIILGLKCLADEDEIFCKDCSFRDMDRGFACKKNVSKAAFDLINRQKAEIERLNHIRAKLSKEFDIWKDIAKRETGYVGIARAEAIKEFAELLKKNARKYTEYDEGGWGCTVYAVKVEDIDKTVEEMTEEADEPHN